MSASTLQERVHRLENPSYDDLGGVGEIIQFGPALTRDIYADRLVAALSTIEEALPTAAIDVIFAILEQNEHPFVVSSAAQKALGISTDIDSQRRLQRCLIHRASNAPTQLQAEMASECLAGALLLADLPGGSRPAIIAALDEIRPGDEPALVRRAALLAGLAWLWHRSPDLVELLNRLATDSEAGEQALFELSIIALDEAICSPDKEALIDGLGKSAQMFDSALRVDPEMVEAEAFAKILTAILLFINGDVETIESALATAISAAIERGNALNHSSLRHWLRPRVDAEVAWYEVALALQGISAELSKPSWLRAVPVLETIAKLRRAVVSAASNSGDQLRESVASRIAGSFLRYEGLRAHLNQWADDPQTSELDRLEAIALIAELDRRRNLGNADGLVGQHEVASPNSARNYARIEALSDLADASGFNAFSESLFLELDRALGEHPDYKDEFRRDTRVILKFLILFLGHCLDVTPTMAEGTFDFLFQRDGGLPLEKEMQRTCWQFLRLQANAFPQQQVVRELPDVAAGRADIAIVRPEWRMVLELKRETSDGSRVGIQRYLGQAAAYELTGPRIGFLMVLDLQSQRDWALTLHDNCWIEEVMAPGDSVPRMICVFRIPGARKAPSSTSTPNR